MTGKEKQTRVRVSEDQILDLFRTYSVLTADQIQALIGVKSPISIRNQIKRMCGSERVNPPLSSRNLARPWLGIHSNIAVFLTDLGAATLSNRYGIRVAAPRPTTLRANFVHGLAVSDIGVALHKSGIPFDVERKVSISEEGDEFIRPDVFCRHKNMRYLIELEQSRSEQALDERLLGRLRRWQKTFTSPEMEDVASDVIVLFSMKKDDQHTIASWMKALHLLEQELGSPAAFTVWAMELSDFLKSPSLDLRRFRKLQPSAHPDSALLAAERERFFDRQIATRISSPEMQAAFEKTAHFYEFYRGRLQSLARDPAERKQFLDHCDRLYALAQFGKWDGAVPWPAIALVRYWLEQPVFAAFRAELIDALERLKSSYGRGLYTAADSMERMVWDVLLRRFGFARGGPLSFHAQIGSGEWDRSPRSGLIPVFSISAPWLKMRERTEQAQATVRSLTWLVTLLVDFQGELGLARASKKAQSAMALDPVTPEEGGSWEESQEAGV